MSANNTTSIKKNHLRGGEFLIHTSDPQATFTPEDYTEEQILLRESMRDFYAQHIDPIREKFDTEEGYTLAPILLEEMGKLGFMGVGVPEEFGGIETDFRTQLAFGEMIADGHAFSLAPGIQASLGVAPILLYGNEAQRQKYLPGIVDCSIKTCYCLTEPGSGSDANAAKTHAILTDDGKFYVLNGQKMWITNAGHADVFFVFAKIEDDKNVSCLIVEKAFGGIVLGREERKMGMKGASTRQVFFENVNVPVENLLWQRDAGFKLALNVLNTGRIKIATAASGSSKRSFNLGLQYALQRVQFGKPIIEFGAIRHKVAEMGTRLYAMESIFCRIGQMIDDEHDALIAKGMAPIEAKYRSIAEFAMECAMAKVYNTEGESFIVDEALQIHGGMGYSGDSEIETLYRNARSNRIYEGTNEINRMLTPSMLLRKVMKGQIDLLNPAQAAAAALMQGEWPAVGDEPYAVDTAMLARLKQAALVVAGSAAQKFMATLADEQEVLMHLADIFMAIFACESALLRSMKHTGGPHDAVRQGLCRLLLHQAAQATEKAGLEILQVMDNSDEIAALRAGIRKCCTAPPDNLIAMRRRVSDHFATQTLYRI